ncbi:unnamed protein product, partial [Prorocentrum cordatum]
MDCTAAVGKTVFRAAPSTINVDPIGPSLRRPLGNATSNGACNNVWEKACTDAARQAGSVECGQAGAPPVRRSNRGLTSSLARPSGACDTLPKVRSCAGTHVAASSEWSTTAPVFQNSTLDGRSREPTTLHRQLPQVLQPAAPYFGHVGGHPRRRGQFETPSAPPAPANIPQQPTPDMRRHDFFNPKPPGLILFRRDHVLGGTPWGPR